MIMHLDFCHLLWQRYIPYISEKLANFDRLGRPYLSNSIKVSVDTYVLASSLANLRRWVGPQYLAVLIIANYVTIEGASPAIFQRSMQPLDVSLSMCDYNVSKRYRKGPKMYHSLITQKLQRSPLEL